MADFNDLVKEHGSVSAALKAQGYSKGSGGTWSKGSSAGTQTTTGSSGTTSKGSGGGSSGGSGSSKGSSGYYDPNLDYSLAIKDAQNNGASQSYISQLQQERQNKIDAIYGGVDPYRPSGGGTESGGTSYGTYGGVSQSIDYQSLINQAVAKGDYTSAAIYEQMRNQKISSPDYKGNQSTTDYYSQYLPENQQMPQFEVPSFEDFLSQMGYDQYSDATQQRIQAAVQQAVNNYNAQIEQTNKDSDELARQAYIAKMLGQKNLDQQLSAAGYAGGMADSQRIETETNYENNLQDIENQRQQVIAELQRAIRDAQLTGDLQAAQELQAYLQSMQSNWLSYVQNQQQMQNTNYWNQRQMQANQQQINAEQQNTAYNRALQLLGMGIMPGTDLLYQANLSQQEAEAIRASVLAEMNAAPAAASSGSRTTSARSSRSAGGYDNGSLTADQVRQMQQALGVTADGMWGSDSRNAAGGLTADEAWAAMQGNRQLSVQQSNLPSYDTILQNSGAGAYGPAYGMTLSAVQAMVNQNATKQRVEEYLLEQMDAGKINELGVATILQALGIEQG